MASAEPCGNRSGIRHPEAMHPAVKLAFFMVCFLVAADTVPAPSKKGIIYSTKRDMPPNIHYIVKIEEEGERKAEEGKEKVKLSCAYARKAGPRGNGDNEKNEGNNRSGESEDDCLKTSGIITAPSRTNEDGGEEDCIGRNRRKDLNGLCRKIWD